MEPVSVQLYRTIIILMLLVTLIMSVSVDTPSAYGLSFSAGHPFWINGNRLSYHFFHGGLLHWSVNAFALLTIAFRWQLPWWHYVLSFIVACLYPVHTTVPVVGLSVWIYALVGIITPVTHSPFRVVVLNLICIFIAIGAIYLTHIISDLLSISRSIPVIAWQAHLYAYCAGVLIGLVSQPVWHRC